MPNEWTQFLVNIVIPNLTIVLLDQEAQVEEERLIMEIEMDSMSTNAEIGQNWQKIDLSFAKLNIIDYVTGSYNYQSIDKISSSGNLYTDGKDNLELNFDLHFETNPRFEDFEVNTRLYTKIHQYILAHMPLVKELQEFFAAGESSEEII